MSLWRKRNEFSALEAHLRDSRPQAPEGLVRSVGHRLRPRPGTARPHGRLAVALALTLVALGVATAFGGLSFAASSVGDAVHVVKRVAKPSKPQAVHKTAAIDQYENFCGSSPNPPCLIEIRPRSMFLNEGDYCVGLTINILQGKVSDGTVAVDWRTVNSTARAPQDYDAAGGTVNFPTGTNTANISVCINDDNQTEPRESFTVQLFNPVNATIEAAGQRTTININENTN
jgi:hypothetical protein